MAVISIEKPIRKRHRTVMNFPRSTSKLGMGGMMMIGIRTILYLGTIWVMLMSEDDNEDIKP